ncbi:hypothetical protein KVR01_003730 [Diaporthe batatas]|uniref:uncharacterized protein n=1 Tax=Diaporthe batatas TaxID=748121 RepID=UPI001D03A135|nr:uncharacterized protein KVR01_003730 [Diaporthe batatas]KAG8168041.1 hypothetical protein KVR01_003730 [Diaporthe batatas]
MSLDHQKLGELVQLLEDYSELQEKRQKVQEQAEKIAQARARGKRAPSVPNNFSENLDADREMTPGQEQKSYDSSVDSDEDMDYTVPPPSIAESPNSNPPAPSEEALRRFATTVAYSSYSNFCGTSDETLVRHLFEDGLQNDSAVIFDPKKMIEINKTDHNIAYLWNELAEAAASPFVASMTEARRRIDPGLTTDDQIRRFGPAEILNDSLPIYWIVTLSQRGVIDWEGGCSLARAYRRVFEKFGVDDVHCLVFEYETDLSGEDSRKAFALE